MPLYGALLQSLYATCEPAFTYTVFVCANEDDKVLGEPKRVGRLFQLAEKQFGHKSRGSSSSRHNGRLNNGGCSIGHVLLLAPRSMVPRTSLSALFNWPTLLAVNYSPNLFSDTAGHSHRLNGGQQQQQPTSGGGGSFENTTTSSSTSSSTIGVKGSGGGVGGANIGKGADYVYLANDDLVLTSHGWTSKFVHALSSNSVWPNLGVAGAVDTSDSITPQIEFPFFHRTHAALLFPWCGANPWVFRNWFEDNWITDVYAPFGKRCVGGVFVLLICFLFLASSFVV
jgi:hypothetical protein